MPKETLMRYQKNQVFRMMEQLNLNPIGFQWEEHASEGQVWDVCSRVVNKDTGYYFLFDRVFYQYTDNYANTVGENVYQVTYFPSPDGELRQRDLVKDWNELLDEPLRDWLSVLQSEINEPDLWSQAEKYSKVFTPKIPSDISNHPFSYQEAERIIKALKQFRCLVIEESELNLHPDMVALLESNLQYLENAAKKQGRVDWINIAVGTLISIFVSLSLDPEKAHIIWRYFRETVGPAIGNMMGLPLN